MPAALKVVSGALKDRVLLLPSDGSAFILGRSLEANLTLSGPRVEDRHAVLIPEAEGGHRLVPVSLKRPTWIGEDVLERVTVLSDGDRIRIGTHTLIYVRPWSREQIKKKGGWGASVSQATITPDTLCSSCGKRMGPKSGGPATLQALRLGGEVFCPRCVDSRMHLSRELESYRILRKIGTNEEEVTYLAVDQETNRRVAVRILKADQQAKPRVFRRFLVRALVGLVLDHPNYLGVQGIRISRGITFVVMQHLEESSKLEVLVRERSPLPVAEAIYITNQLAEILRYAREKQIVVAKRKKSGVLVDRRFWVKVLAYDVTRDLEEMVSQTEAFRDLADRSGFDPEYLATAETEPLSEEEARREQLASEFAEVYSVGRILYQLLSGKPFGPGTIDAIKESHTQARLYGAPRRGALQGHAPPVVSLLERVIVPRGEDRIRTLEEFTQASKAAYNELLLVKPQGDTEPPTD